MALSKSSLLTAFFGRLLVLYHGVPVVHPSTTVVYREGEVLYAQVREDVEYLVMPRDWGAVTDLHDAQQLGLSQFKGRFLEAARSRDAKAMKSNLIVYDYYPFNVWDYYNERVAKAKLFRLQYGETLEYEADVARHGRCFENITLIESSFHSGGPPVREEVPQSVREEIEQICANGFSALQSTSNHSVLDGIYAGSRKERTLQLAFRRGELIDADLTVEEGVGMNRRVIFHPICNGVFALVKRVERVPESRNTFLILKKVRGRDKGLFAGILRLMGLRKPRGYNTRALCNVREHERRHLSGPDLRKWDLDLPPEFNIQFRPRKS
ncbi:hypothetical protein FOL46_008277 [Perkinsus olseni]|uniref:Uncharacterized protein n=1 Tax=Perkinsus olseni TaxID=32597 RepID=A0A7J6L841_PEROL|nr:hypothetical protein FOL46_008277 [Perkinsus olseni]